MKSSRTFWFSSAATATVIAALVAGGAAASAREEPARAKVTTSALSRHPAGPGGSAAQHLGKMIHTGLDATQVSEWVIKAVPVTVADSAEKTFGFAMDDRAND